MLDYLSSWLAEKCDKCNKLGVKRVTTLSPSKRAIKTERNKTAFEKNYNCDRFQKPKEYSADLNYDDIRGQITPLR